MKKMDEKPPDEGNRPFMRQCFVTANVSMTYLGNGCAIGIVAILIPGLRNKESHIHASVNEESWIAATLGLSQLIGNVLVTSIIDGIGRRKCYFLAILPLLLGWFILLFANNVAGLIAARFFHGFGIGIYGFLGIIFIGEMTEPKNRGIFLTTVSLSLTIGILFSHALGSLLDWQTSALICSFTTFISLLMLFYTPESPPWLISKGRYEEARHIYFWLRGNGETQETELETMVAAQKRTLKSTVPGQTLPISRRTKQLIRYFYKTCKELGFYKPTTIMIFVYIMYQFAGVNVVYAFTIDIIEGVVGPEANSNLLMILLDFERLLCNILVVYLMKVMKRRTLLFGAGFTCIFIQFLMGAYVYFKQNQMLVYNSQWIAITLITVYMFMLTVGISSIPFVLAGEIFPLEYRGLGSGISMIALAVNFFIAVKLFPILNSSAGLSVTFTLYASIATVSLCVVWFLLPETKDRTLQDIEDTLRGNSAVDVKSSKPLREANDVEMMENN